MWHVCKFRPIRREWLLWRMWERYGWLNAPRQVIWTSTALFIERERLKVKRILWRRLSQDNTAKLRGQVLKTRISLGRQLHEDYNCILGMCTRAWRYLYRPLPIHRPTQPDYAILVRFKWTQNTACPASLRSQTGRICRQKHHNLPANTTLVSTLVICFHTHSDDRVGVKFSTRSYVCLSRIVTRNRRTLGLQSNRFEHPAARRHHRRNQSNLCLVSLSVGNYCYIYKKKYVF